MSRPLDTNGPLADVHGGRIREAAARLGRPPEEVLDFSANINFLGPTPRVLAAAHDSLDEISWYPADPPLELRAAAAAFLQVVEDSVVLGNGASELIALTVACLRPARVLILGPTFTEYERAARAWGAEVDVLQLPAERDFRLGAAEIDLQSLRARVARAGLIFLCDPNNPTGDLLDQGLRDLLVREAGSAGVPVFADESFLAFTRAWPEGSLTRSAEPHVIVLHSFTKILALPGLRLGALVLPGPLRERIGGRVPPWNLNCVAQAAGLAGFSETALLAGTPQVVGAARDELAARLAALGGIARVLPAAANFLCLRLGVAAASTVTARMRDEHAVLVRDLTDFPGMGAEYLRVAVRSPEQNEVLARALASVLGEPHRAAGDVVSSGRRDAGRPPALAGREGRA